jgi:hypothetical protein
VGAALKANPLGLISFAKRDVAGEVTDLYGSVSYKGSQSPGAAPYHPECFDAMVNRLKKQSQ